MLYVANIYTLVCIYNVYRFIGVQCIKRKKQAEISLRSAKIMLQHPITGGVKNGFLFFVVVGGGCIIQGINK